MREQFLFNQQKVQWDLQEIKKAVEQGKLIFICGYVKQFERAQKWKLLNFDKVIIFIFCMTTNKRDTQYNIYLFCKRAILFFQHLKHAQEEMRFVKEVKFTGYQIKYLILLGQ